jgi:hypothetical protein
MVNNEESESRRRVRTMLKAAALKFQATGDYFAMFTIGRREVGILNLHTDEVSAALAPTVTSKDASLETMQSVAQKLLLKKGMRGSISVAGLFIPSDETTLSMSSFLSSFELDGEDPRKEN